MLDEVSIGKAFNLIAGTRYDEYDDIGGNLSPRVGLVYIPLEPLYLKILYGQAFRAPNFRELYNKNNPIQAGNPKLGPEKISAWEGQIGVRLKKRINASMTFFQTEMKDTIMFVRPKDASLFGLINDNVGTIRSKGIEGEMNAHGNPVKAEWYI